jgi:hypothetical protein
MRRLGVARKSSGRRVVGAALVIVVALASGAVALGVGFNHVATLVPGGRQVRASGIGPRCAVGETISVAVLVSQGGRIAKAQTKPRLCSGRAQRWTLTASAVGGRVFKPGMANAVARARITRAHRTVATKRSSGVLVLRCPGAPRSPVNGPLAQISLDPPSGSSRASGIAVVVRSHRVLRVVLRAVGLRPNTNHDAYAVWLYNRRNDNRLLGFVNPGVGSDGVMQTAVTLPADAGCYRRLIVSLETDSSPGHPHNVALSGDFSLG